MRKFVGMAIYNIVPLPMREDFLQNYNCYPPPVFMVIISLIEVREITTFFSIRDVLILRNTLNKQLRDEH